MSDPLINYLSSSIPQLGFLSENASDKKDDGSDTKL